MNSNPCIGIKFSSNKSLMPMRRHNRQCWFNWWAGAKHCVTLCLKKSGQFGKKYLGCRKWKPQQLYWLLYLCGLCSNRLLHIWAIDHLDTDHPLAVVVAVMVIQTHNIDKCNPYAKYTFDHSKRHSHCDWGEHNFRDLDRNKRTFWKKAADFSSLKPFPSALLGSPSCQLA